MTKTHAQPEVVTAKELANTVLGVLRHFRDNEQEEWDALMRTQSSVTMLTLWDALKSIAYQGCPAVAGDKAFRG